MRAPRLDRLPRLRIAFGRSGGSDDCLIEVRGRQHHLDGMASELLGQPFSL
jgi:hypothetical protein